MGKNSGTVSIDELEFRGLIGNLDFRVLTGPMFFNALALNGWREAHAGNVRRDALGAPIVDPETGEPRRTSGHILQRLRSRGPRWGVLTPNDFARALRDGETRPSRGAQLRVCQGGEFWVVYREQNCSLITIRDPAD